jgi:hypothetical protein
MIPSMPTAQSRMASGRYADAPESAVLPLAFENRSEKVESGSSSPSTSGRASWWREATTVGRARVVTQLIGGKG